MQGCVARPTVEQEALRIDHMKPAAAVALSHIRLRSIQPTSRDIEAENAPDGNAYRFVAIESCPVVASVDTLKIHAKVKRINKRWQSIKSDTQSIPVDVSYSANRSDYSLKQHEYHISSGHDRSKSSSFRSSDLTLRFSGDFSFIILCNHHHLNSALA